MHASSRAILVSIALAAVSAAGADAPGKWEGAFAGYLYVRGHDSGLIRVHAAPLPPDADAGAFYSESVADLQSLGSCELRVAARYERPGDVLESQLAVGVTFDAPVNEAVSVMVFVPGYRNHAPRNQRTQIWATCSTALTNTTNALAGASATIPSVWNIGGMLTPTGAFRPEFAVGPDLVLPPASPERRDTHFLDADWRDLPYDASLGCWLIFDLSAGARLSIASRLLHQTAGANPAPITWLTDAERPAEITVYREPLLGAAGTTRRVHAEEFVYEFNPPRLEKWLTEDLYLPYGLGDYGATIMNDTSVPLVRYRLTPPYEIRVAVEVVHDNDPIDDDVWGGLRLLTSALETPGGVYEYRFETSGQTIDLDQERDYFYPGINMYSVIRAPLVEFDSSPSTTGMVYARARRLDGLDSVIQNGLDWCSCDVGAFCSCFTDTRYITEPIDRAWVRLQFESTEGDLGNARGRLRLFLPN